MIPEVQVAIIRDGQVRDRISASGQCIPGRFTAAERLF